MTEAEMREKVAREIASINEMDPDEDWPRFEDDACAILSIALPWAREQALREAANVAGTLSETTFDNMPEFNAVLCVEAAILALIPSRPSQETTEG